MKRFLIAAGLVLLASPGLEAQDRPMRQELAEQVTRRFLAMYVQQAGLDEAQRERFAEVIRGMFEQNAARARRERGVWMALEHQMRPGVAADSDSLIVLLDAALALQEEETAGMRRMQAELAEFLSPIQRAQFALHWQRLQRQIDNVRGGRRGRGPRGPGGPGNMPF